MKNLINTTAIFFLLSFYLIVFVGCKNSISHNDFNYEEKYVIQLDSGRVSRSACIVNNYIYVLSGINNYYQKINLESGKMTQEKFPVEFQNPSTIIYNRNRIIVSDIMDKSLTFFDNNFKFNKRVVLNRFPLDFRIHKNKCVFLTDIVHKGMYNFIIVKENILSHKEEVVFSGDTLNTSDFRNILNLDIPGTLCYDYDGVYIYAARQRYDSYIIYKFRPGKYSLMDEFINDQAWRPVEYNESEYTEAKAIYSDILAESKYPLSKLIFSHKLAILSITIDNEGRLWVINSKNGNSLSLNVYSNSGEKIKNIEFSGIHNAKILVSENYFALLETDTLYPRIFVYKLQNKVVN